MTPTSGLDPARTKLIYDWDAERYLRSLPLEHFMEATAQATQRKVTVVSFDLIHEARPEVQCFSELLIQYPRPGEDPDAPARVVPDNMVVVHPHPIQADRSYMLPLQPVGPFLVLEYVSTANRRKDYDDSYRKYERELRVPYYLMFYPDNEELTLFRLAPTGYITVTPNAAGRLAIPELELEVALLDGWARYWFRSELVPLPTDLLKMANAAEQHAREAEARATEAGAARVAAELQAKEAGAARVAAELQAREAGAARVAAEQRAVAAEAELTRLREELAKARGPG